MVDLKAGVTDTGITEYYLVGLEWYEDIEPILDQLIHMNAKILDTLDGIYSRMATLEMEGITFKVVYHEDVGVYSHVTGESSKSSDNQLRHILEQVVISINMKGT